MKPLVSLILLFASFSIALAQSPALFNYQAVIRNAEGEILTNQMIDLRFEIIQGSENGSAVFSETHSTSSNHLGLVVVQVGNGEIESGSMSLIVLAFTATQTRLNA